MYQAFMNQFNALQQGSFLGIQKKVVFVKQ